jgi:hypothetical protein
VQFSICERKTRILSVFFSGHRVCYTVEEVLILGGSVRGRESMKIQKILALGIVAAAGYYLYRCFAAARCDWDSQTAELPDSVIEENPVDEASWESFPASDAPSFNLSRSTTS